MDGGHEAEAHGSTNGLGNLTLVDGAQTGLFAVLDAAERGYVLGHDGEVLESGEPMSVVVSECRLLQEWQNDRIGNNGMAIPSIAAEKLLMRTLYKSNGFRFRASKASREGLLRLPHFFISAGLRS